MKLSLTIKKTEYTHDGYCSDVDILFDCDLKSLDSYLYTIEIIVPYELNDTYFKDNFLLKDYYFTIRDYIDEFNNIIDDKGHCSCCGGGIRQEIQEIRKLQ